MKIQQRSDQALDQLRVAAKGTEVNPAMLARVLEAPVERHERAAAQAVLDATKALSKAAREDLSTLKATMTKLEADLKTLKKAGIGQPSMDLEHLQALRGRVDGLVAVLGAARALEAALTIETKHADLSAAAQAAFEGGAISKTELSMLTDGGISGIIYRNIAAKIEVGRREREAIVKTSVGGTAQLRTDIEARLGLLSRVMSEMNKLVDRQVSSEAPIDTFIGGLRAGTLLRVVAHDKKPGHFVEDLAKALLAPSTLEAEAKFIAQRTYQLAISQIYLVVAALGAAMFASDRSVMATAKLAYVIPSSTQTG